MQSNKINTAMKRRNRDRNTQQDRKQWKMRVSRMKTIQKSRAANKMKDMIKIKK